MSENLTTSVRREIDRLKEEIGQRTSQLASLKDELRRHQKVYGLLRGADRTARKPKRPRRRARRIAPVNWDSVLQGLSSRFTIGDFTKAADAKGKSPVYLRQIAIRWTNRAKPKESHEENTKRLNQGSRELRRDRKGKNNETVVSHRFSTLVSKARLYRPSPLETILLGGRSLKECAPSWKV